MATLFVKIDRDTAPLPPELRNWVPGDHLAHFILDGWDGDCRCEHGAPPTTSAASTRSSAPPACIAPGSRFARRRMIGVFDSGFGGLTVFASLTKALPQYDYVFLADSARAPYGARSPDVINEFSLEAVEWLFDEGCTLVVMACNTASARALRNIQQLHLPVKRPDRRVLGVVRPSVEALAGLPPGAIPGETLPSDATGTVAVLATESTVASDSYGIELRKLAPGIELIQQACPMWVPLVEAGELAGPGTDWFLRQSLDPVLDRPQPPRRLLLGCTHFPLLLPALRRLVPASVEILDQAEIVTVRLADWLRRHPEHESRLPRGGRRRFATTDDAAWFATRGERLLGRKLEVERVRLEPVR